MRKNSATAFFTWSPGNWLSRMTVGAASRSLSVVAASPSTEESEVEDGRQATEQLRCLFPHEDLADGLERQVLLVGLRHEGLEADAGDLVRLLHRLPKLEGLLVSQLVDALEHVRRVVDMGDRIGPARLCGSTGGTIGLKGRLP